MSMHDHYERKVFYSKEDRGWIAVAPELPGCSAFGASSERALKELETAMALWLETAKAKRWTIPPPLADKKTDGRIFLRLPRELHRDYRSLATQEGVSLNQFKLYVLARYRDLGSFARYVK
jgi:predicted RNase H-like HicB family nuclease